MRWTSVLVIVCAVACSKSAEKKRPRMVSDAELAQLEARAMARMTAAHKTSCPRPVVHGTPVPGAAGPHIVAFVEQRPEVAACSAALETGPAKVGDVIDWRHPYAREVELRCSTELATLLHAAITRTDACSPYQIGKRALPTLMPMFRAGRLLELRARRLAEEGDAEAALWLLVELAAFTQDLERGSPGIVLRQVGLSLALVASEAASEIANKGTLSPAAIDGLAKGIDSLLTTTSPLASAVQAELDSFAIHDYIPRVKPADWVPPGGWPEAYSRDPKPASKPFLDLREEMGFMLATNEAQSKRFEVACPATANLRVCHEGFAALAALATTEPLEKMYATIVGLGAATEQEAMLAVRETFTDALVVAAAPGYGKYATSSASFAVRFSMVRVHLEVLRFVATNKRCPTLAELDAPPFDAARSPAELGDRLQIEAVPAGFAIKPPVFFHSKREPYQVRCPAPAP